MNINNYNYLIGKKFTHLTVLSVYRNKDIFCICECDCENKTIKHIRKSDLEKTYGGIVSCGCHRKSLLTTHSLSKTPEYKIWKGIKKRCLNKNDKHYKNYGGRGITICQEWINDFPAFLKHVGKRPSNKYSLDRIDNNKGYEINNVRWATKKEQNRNKRNNLLTEKDANEIRIIFSQGILLQKEIAFLYNLPLQTVNAIIKNKIWV